MRYVPLGLILDNTGKVLRIRIGYCDVKALWDNWLFCDNSQSNYTRIPYIDVNPCWMMRNCKFQFSKSLPKVGIDNINTKLIAINDPSDASPRGYVQLVPLFS